MSHNNSKCQRQEEDDNDNVSINSSMDNTLEGGAKDAKLAALESKNALLEAKNEILQGKLENQELRARNCELMEENAALKHTNVEQKAQIENNEQKFDEFTKLQQKEIYELKAKNEEDREAFGKKIDEAHEKAQRQINELKETTLSLVEGMRILKEKQEQQNNQQHGLDQMKPEHLWDHLIKAKQLVKTNRENSWNSAKTTGTISLHGLQVSDSTNQWISAVAMEAFGIASGRNCRKNLFPGTVVYYYEVTQMASASTATSSSTAANWWIGLSDGCIQGAFGKHPNSYAFHKDCISCTLSGKDHRFEHPNGGIKLELNGQGHVIGCGLGLNPKGKIAIFFTGNGTLLGKPIPISPSVDRLYPTVFIWNVSLEANFGDDQAKPFKYDIDKCPGMEF